MTFRIAHLSDVHLAPLPPVALADLNLKQLLGYANWQYGRKRQQSRAVLDRLVADVRLQHADHVVITGDFANLGLMAEMRAAAHFIAGIGGPDFVTVIPGNHDAYAGTDFSPLLPWMGADGAGFPFVKIQRDVALIGLSSAVKTPPFYASGRLGQAQLNALAAILPKLKEQNLARVVLIHHPPLRGQSNGRRGLTDAAALAAVLGEFGAELVLHGHNHRWMEAELPGKRSPVIGVPAASATPSAHGRAGYAIHTLSRSDDSWTVTTERRQP